MSMEEWFAIRFYDNRRGWLDFTLPCSRYTPDECETWATHLETVEGLQVLEPKVILLDEREWTPEMERVWNWMCGGDVAAVTLHWLRNPEIRPAIVEAMREEAMALEGADFDRATITTVMDWLALPLRDVDAA
ncbi:hypothetical protein [Fimbriimonas ginsengisoli]|nr:hypothetical protein [Fimbriimonas ginsengisoli]